MSHAISALVAENALLHQENSGVKETTANEKKRRQRGKPLLLQPPENYGGAIFWSPQKVKEARIQQEQKELMEEEAQHQKDEANRLKAEQKLLKQYEADLKREMRLKAKEAKAVAEAKKKLEKQEAKEAKQLEKQLKSDLQLSQKGKKRSLKAQSKPQVNVGGILDVLVSEEQTEAPEVLSRSGRKIKLPARFK